MAGRENRHEITADVTESLPREENGARAEYFQMSSLLSSKNSNSNLVQPSEMTQRLGRGRIRNYFSFALFVKWSSATLLRYRKLPFFRGGGKGKSVLVSIFFKS